MKVSIGVLAHNEEKVIEGTLASLLNQTAFLGAPAESPGRSWEIVVVANGCRDGTARVARQFLEKRLAEPGRPALSFRVLEVEKPGKSNAWNLFVHEHSAKDAEVLVFIDADIEFDHPETLANCLHELETNGHARVVVDLPRKHFERLPRKSLLQRISLRASRASQQGPPAIAGSFYCARSALLREIWMPPGLPVEDGFLYSMVVTDLFRAEPDSSRVARAANASHFFEGLSGLRQIYRHELRMVIGTSLNCYFTWDFLKFATDPKGPGAGHLIRNQMAGNPDWYRRTLENQIANRGRWVLPRGMLFRRFSILRGRGLLGGLLRIPLALLGFLLDLPLLCSANRKIRRGKAIGYW